jgi:hypothetical protein
MPNCLAVVRGYAAVRIGDRVIPSSFSNIGAVATFNDTMFDMVTPFYYEGILTHTGVHYHYWVQVDPRRELVGVLACLG